jgi:pimeloyl-ACP methyl ester carboxylesterase
MITFKRLSQLLLPLVAMALASTARADYAEVNDIRLYYETHGSCDTTVVMLHGGYDDSDVWALETWRLARDYRVIEIDSRGHGRSYDGDGPITYERMTDDTLDLLDQLGVERAHFVGWSDGGVIASQIAANHPERVNQLILFGAAFGGDVYTDLFSMLLDDKKVFNAIMDTTFGFKYRKTSPTPDHWPVFRDKVYEMWQAPCYFAEQPEDYCLEPLERISAPTLVVAGEQEIIRRSHTEAIAEAIPGAELKIVPLASHFMPKFRSLTSTRLIVEFLNN